MRVVPGLAALVLTLGLAMSCSGGALGGCTEKGCGVDGLVIDLGAASSGHYVVTGSALEGPRRCEFDVPEGANNPACAMVLPASVKVSWVGFAPSEVLIIVTRDGKALKSMPNTKPTYTTSRPNGPNCGPECKNGTVSVSVD